MKDGQQQIFNEWKSTCYKSDPLWNKKGETKTDEKGEGEELMTAIVIWGKILEYHSIKPLVENSMLMSLMQ